MRFLALLTLAAALTVPPAARANWLDLTSFAPGSSGSFSGTLGSVTVTGTLSVTYGAFEFANGVTANTSPQFSYSDVYSPSIPLTDQVGYTSHAGTSSDAIIAMVFSEPVTNPVFDVANLDATQFYFSPTINLGLTGLVLLQGNGGGGDGIQVIGDIIKDSNPSTGVAQAWSEHPLMTGDRSAYGSVLIEGTFTSLIIENTTLNLNGDGGTFTLSDGVPEPATLALSAGGLLLVLGAAKRRRKTN